MTHHHSLSSAARLSDGDLLDATSRVAADERCTTAELLALLAELDSRKLYLAQGYSSLFTYCTHHLHLSEPAAYSRITAARAARRFPVVLVRLAAGEVTLTNLTLLTPHLTHENHEALLDAAQHTSRRDVERLIASLYGQPDIPTTLRRVPAAGPASSHESEPAAPLAEAGTALEVDARTPSASSSPVLAPVVAAPPVSTAVPSAAEVARASVAALAVDRYLLRVTIGAETRARLDRACDLLRHVVPNGDIALILDRALAVLVDQLERRKTGRVLHRRPAGAPSKPSHGRHIPAAVRRKVWTRDNGRCAFVGRQGRCRETGFLEYHHVVPYSRGGRSDVANLQLRCRAHNAFEATIDRPGT